jgi:hypothetical protein
MDYARIWDKAEAEARAEGRFVMYSKGLVRRACLPL